MNATNQHYLSELKNFFADAKVCRASSRLVEHLSVRLAAMGEAAEVLAIVKESPEAETLEEFELKAGDCMDVPRGLIHQMEALEDAELLEFSTQHFDSDSYRLVPGD